MWADNSKEEISAKMREVYNVLLEQLSAKVSQSGAQLIIVYYPHLQIHSDGRASALKDEELVTSFDDICKKNNILFLDMSNRFIDCYEKEHILPHGFFNTSVRSGHLNKNGHEMIGNAVYELIMGIMSFASFEFLIYFCVILIGASCLQRSKYIIFQEVFLLLASYFFYGYWD